MGSGGRRRPLADVGPHPNPSKAAAGQRIHRLEPDPVTAPVVERICAMFGVDELGLRAIAETLTAEGIPSPSTPPRGRTSWAALLAGRFGSSLYLLLPGRSDLPGVAPKHQQRGSPSSTHPSQRPHPPGQAAVTV